MSGDSIAQDQLLSFFARWRNLEAEKAAVSEDLKQLFAEMKGNGFDTKVARVVFRDKTKDQAERLEFEAIYDLYAAALNGTQFANARDVREDDDEFDPETGEVSQGGEAATREAHNLEIAGANPAPASNSVDPNRQVLELPGEDIGGGEGGRTVLPVPTPDDGGDTVEPDSGPELPGGVATAGEAQLDEQPRPKGTVAGSNPAVSANPLCLKHRAGKECPFSHKGYSCSECNFQSFSARPEKQKAAA